LILVCAQMIDSISSCQYALPLYKNMRLNDHKECDVMKMKVWADITSLLYD